MGPKAELFPHEVTLLDSFLRNSGKMLILREPNGPNLDLVTTPWGLRFHPGVVVDPERSQSGDTTRLIVNDFPSNHPVVRGVDVALVVTAGGVVRLPPADPPDLGLTVTPVFRSSEPSWLEMHPTVGAYEPDEGDRGGPVVLGGAADRSEVKPTGETRIPGGGPAISRTRLLVYADANWADNTSLEAAANQRLFVNGLNWLAGEEDLVAIPGEDPDLRRLILTSSQRRNMGIVSIGVVPALALLAGTAVWLRRRRR
jgi:ABC-type uncharacterized transport system involved in gliding motility auxiliary subunit